MKALKMKDTSRGVERCGCDLVTDHLEPGHNGLFDLRFIKMSWDNKLDLDHDNRVRICKLGRLQSDHELKHKPSIHLVNEE